MAAAWLLGGPPDVSEPMDTCGLLLWRLPKRSLAAWQATRCWGVYEPVHAAAAMAAICWLGLPCKLSRFWKQAVINDMQDCSRVAVAPFICDTQGT